MHVFLFMLLDSIFLFAFCLWLHCFVMVVKPSLLLHGKSWKPMLSCSQKNLSLGFLKKNEGKKYTRGQVDFTGSTKSMVIYMFRAGKLQFKQTSADLWCQFQLNVNSWICQLGHKIYLFSEVVQILLMEPVSLWWEIMPRNKYSIVLFLLTSAQKLSASE